MWTSKVVNTVF